MITLLVNVYAEDPEPAIASAEEHLPISRTIELHGRYEGFPDLGGPSKVYASEHAKRNELLRLAGPADPNRWLLWLDCDERVVYASPAITLQLARASQDVAGVRFVEPLQPDAPGLEDPRRSAHDHVVVLPRLIRHLPDLRFTRRHDHLVDGYDGRVLVGWANERSVLPEAVDVMLLHLRTQSPERIAAKELFYSGPVRRAESRDFEEAEPWDSI